MNRLAKHRWFRSLHGGLWFCTLSCGWYPVSHRDYIHHEMFPDPRVIAWESHAYDNTLLQGVLIGVAIVCAVIAVGLASGAIPS